PRVNDTIDTPLPSVTYTEHRMLTWLERGGPASRSRWLAHAIRRYEAPRRDRARDHRAPDHLHPVLDQHPRSLGPERFEKAPVDADHPVVGHRPDPLSVAGGWKL